MPDEYQRLMNDTKWEEIRLALYNYATAIEWRTKDKDSDFISAWDTEWFYHFREGGYRNIQWLEIKTPNEYVKTDLVNILRSIHVPGEVLTNSIKIYGYIPIGTLVDFLDS